MSVGFVLAILVSGLITGGLARLAIPGPDPMPIWLTIAIGLTGSIVGAVVGDAISDDNGYVVSFLSFGIANRARPPVMKPDTRIARTKPTLTRKPPPRARSDRGGSP